MLSCRTCGETFARPVARGRVPYYCGDRCRWKAKRLDTKRRIAERAVAATLAGLEVRADVDPR